MAINIINGLALLRKDWLILLKIIIIIFSHRIIIISWRLLWAWDAASASWWCSQFFKKIKKIKIIIFFQKQANLKINFYTHNIYNNTDARIIFFSLVFFLDCFSNTWSLDVLNTIHDIIVLLLNFFTFYLRTK